MTLFVGGPWDGRDVPLTAEEQTRPYVVMAYPEINYLAEEPQTATATQTMYVPHRWHELPGDRICTVFAVSWWGAPEVELAVSHWRIDHPGERLPW